MCPQNHRLLFEVFDENRLVRLAFIFSSSWIPVLFQQRAFYMMQTFKKSTDFICYMARIWLRIIINLLLGFPDLHLYTIAFLWTTRHMKSLQVKELTVDSFRSTWFQVAPQLQEKREWTACFICYFHCPTLKFTATFLLCQIYQISPAKEGTSFHHLSNESSWRPAVTMTTICTVFRS